MWGAEDQDVDWDQGLDQGLHLGQNLSRASDVWGARDWDQDMD